MGRGMCSLHPYLPGGPQLLLYQLPWPPACSFNLSLRDLEGEERKARPCEKDQSAHVYAGEHWPAPGFPGFLMSSSSCDGWGWRTPF